MRWGVDLGALGTRCWSRTPQDLESRHVFVQVPGRVSPSEPYITNASESLHSQMRNQTHSPDARGRETPDAEICRPAVAPRRTSSVTGYGTTWAQSSFRTLTSSAFAQDCTGGGALYSAVTGAQLR